MNFVELGLRRGPGNLARALLTYTGPGFLLFYWGPNICVSLRRKIGFPSQGDTDLPWFATSPSLVAHHVGLSCLLKDSHREQTGKEVYFVFLVIIVSAIFFGTGS